MVTTVWIEETFNAGHWLPGVPADHKCRRPHGHTYHVRLEVEGEVGEDTGWMYDWDELRAEWRREVFDVVDHRMLNDIAGLENPTSEVLAAWILRRMPLVRTVTIRETATAGATVRR